MQQSVQCSWAEKKKLNRFRDSVRRRRDRHSELNYVAETRIRSRNLARVPGINGNDFVNEVEAISTQWICQEKYFLVLGLLHTGCDATSEEN